MADDEESNYLDGSARSSSEKETAG